MASGMGARVWDNHRSRLGTASAESDTQYQPDTDSSKRRYPPTRIFFLRANRYLASVRWGVDK